MRCAVEVNMTRATPIKPAEPREPGSVKVTVTLPEELVRDLDAHAAAEQRTRSERAAGAAPGSAGPEG